jgi:hypothetical protein
LVEVAAVETMEVLKRINPYLSGGNAVIFAGKQRRNSLIKFVFEGQREPIFKKAYRDYKFSRNTFQGIVIWSYLTNESASVQKWKI